MKTDIAAFIIALLKLKKSYKVEDANTQTKKEKKRNG